MAVRIPPLSLSLNTSRVIALLTLTGQIYSIDSNKTSRQWVHVSIYCSYEHHLQMLLECWLSAGNHPTVKVIFAWSLKHCWNDYRLVYDLLVSNFTCKLTCSNLPRSWYSAPLIVYRDSFSLWTWLHFHNMCWTVYSSDVTRIFWIYIVWLAFCKQDLMGPWQTTTLPNLIHTSCISCSLRKTDLGSKVKVIVALCLSLYRILWARYIHYHVAWLPSSLMQKFLVTRGRSLSILNQGSKVILICSS